MLNTARTCAENTFITAANSPNRPFHAERGCSGDDSTGNGHPTPLPTVRHARTRGDAWLLGGSLLSCTRIRTFFILFCRAIFLSLFQSHAITENKNDFLL